MSPTRRRSPTCGRHLVPNSVAQGTHLVAQFAALQLVSSGQKCLDRHFTGRDQVRGGQLPAARGLQHDVLFSYS